MRAFVAMLVPAVLVSIVELPASADVIGGGWRPPSCTPIACEPGSSDIGAGSHSSCSPGCGPNAACETDAECTAEYGEGATCVETRFCLGQTFVARIGPHSIVLAACGSEGACATGECSVARRCNPPPPREEPEPPPAPVAAPAGPRAETATSRGGGCAISRVPSHSAWWLTALVGVAITAGRRFVRRRCT